MTTMTKETLYAQANEFIDALDRSELGIFAVPVGALVLAEVSRRAAELEEAGVSFEYNFGGSARIRMAVGLRRERFNQIDVWAELYYWRNRLGLDVPELPLRTQRDRRDNLAAVERLAVLDMVVRHPVEMHEYFELDIWDTDYISQCLSYGVDAAVANSMTRIVA